MSTKGNLELRAGDKTFKCAAVMDGYNVYQAIPEFTKFLDNNPKPTTKQYFSWAEETGKGLFGACYYEGGIGGVPCEVVIDTNRRLILHNAILSDLESCAINFPRMNFPTMFHTAIRKLKRKYDYQTLRFTKKAI